MYGYQIAFNQPSYLLLLFLLPLLWLFSYRSLSGLGPVRRIFALGLRTLVLVLMICCLAEVQWQRASDRLTVFYLLDQSESIPRPTREAMLNYVMEEVRLHRRTSVDGQGGDRPGVIIFGREALIESPPFDDEIRTIGKLDSLIDLRTDATNIGAALKQAQASFPEDTAKRIVIISDGNENLGDAQTIARSLVEQGIGIDVVPIRLDSRSEIAVEAVRIPADIRRGTPSELRVIVNNYKEPTATDSGTVTGRVRLTMKQGQQEQLLAEVPATLPPGKTVLPFQHTIEAPSSYTFRADFVPDVAAEDFMQQNNSATAFTHVRGKGRVLLIEDWEHPGEFNRLVDALGKQNLEVEVMQSNRLYASLAELQGYDCVVLANLPRASGGAADDAASFSDEQVSMLVRNTEQMGCGIVMVGGDRSFGAGGWSNTELEKAMPVDFQIRNDKVKAVGALVMMMHASELAQGNYWQKVIGEEALKVLSPADYCGVIHWDDFTSKDDWLWKGGLTRIGNQQKSMLAAMQRMQPGDMPDFDPAMRKTYTALFNNPAAVKLAIVISDGDPSPPDPKTIRLFSAAKIPITTVAVGTHGPAGSTPLQQIASSTGGKYYVVTNAKALPRIFQIEARKVAKPLVFEPEGGLQPQIVDRSHEILNSIDSLPASRGFVMTTLKENPLVEVAIQSPKPANSPENSTYLATWTYGAGRTAVFTSDAGNKWNDEWMKWDGYEKFFSQMVRWAMRPVNQEGKFLVASEYKDGRVRVVINARDKEDEYLDNLNFNVVGSGPELETIRFPIKQEGPGRYVGDFPADEAGSYLLAISPGRDAEGNDYAPILSGVTVPYSSEYRERESNQALLLTLASLQPKGGEAGQVIEGDLANNSLEEMLKIDTFRPTLPKAISSHDAWPVFLLIAAGLFFGDVLVRRVQMHVAWIGTGLAHLWNRMRGREEVSADTRMDRLRSLKAKVGEELDTRRAATRFDPQADADVPQRSLDEALADAGAEGGAAPPPRPTTQQSGPHGPEENTYTERLLAAKKKAKKDLPKSDDNPT